MLNKCLLGISLVNRTTGSVIPTTTEISDYEIDQKKKYSLFVESLIPETKNGERVANDDNKHLQRKDTGHTCDNCFLTWQC